MNDNWLFDKLTLGIRHKRTFAVTDKIGEFADLIIPLQGISPFPEKCFSKIGHPDKYSVELMDDERTLSVIYNTDGLVLTCDMLAEPPLDSKTVLEMFSEISQRAIPLTEGKNKIDRLGAVLQYSLSPFSNSAKTLLSHILNPSINFKGIPDEFYFKFALKNPSSEAVYHPGQKADYKNAFIRLVSSREKEDEEEETEAFPNNIKLAIDYQWYFEPLHTFKPTNINSLFLEAKHYVDNIVEPHFNFHSLISSE